MKTFGERVKEARLQRGLSQQDLADAIGMKSRSTINKIELGSRTEERHSTVQSRAWRGNR